MKRLQILGVVLWACLSFGAQAQMTLTPPGQAAPSAATQPNPEPPASHPAVELARTLLGIPYRWAGADPARGFDCSGLVYYVFNQLQVRIPRMQRDLFKSAEQVGRSDLQPGDLLFFNTFARLSHVGIYIGEGRFIHAPRLGHNVSIESLDSKYYQGRYAGARRVMTSTTAPASPAPGF